MFATAFVLLVALSTYSVASNVEQYLNPDWIEPHAWAGEKNPLQQLCPHVPVGSTCDRECDKRTIEIAFRKLVHNLFARDKFKQDDSSSFLYRSVHIHATEEQLLKLHKLADPDEIDGMLAEILSQSNFGATQLIKEYTMEATSSIWDNISFSFDIPPRTKEITTNFALLVFAYIVCRRYGINFMVVITFGVGYLLYEYLDYECHKRIAVEDTLSFMYGLEENPCEASTNKGWFSFFLGKNHRAECHDYLIKQSRDGKQCGIVDLFHEFTSNILFKQMSTFFMKLADLIQSISATYGIIVTVITLFFMKDILKVMIYSIFKFILNPTSWSGFTAAARNPHIEVPPPQGQIAQAVDIKDVNMGKALDLANSKIQLMLNENAISAAIKAHLPPPSVQRTSSIEGQAAVKHPQKQSEARDASSTFNTRLQLEPSGIQRLPHENETTSSDSSAGPTSESESYDEITYDELVSATVANIVATAKIEPLTVEGQTSLSEELDILDDGKSSKSSSSSTLPSDIELLIVDTDSFGDKNDKSDLKL